MRGDGKKSVWRPAFAEDDLVPGRALAKVLIRERLSAQFPDIAKLGAVFLFPVPEQDDARGVGLRRLGSYDAGQRGQSCEYRQFTHVRLLLDEAMPVSRRAASGRKPFTYAPPKQWPGECAASRHQFNAQRFSR
jgi:hypothetical protein